MKLPSSLKTSRLRIFIPGPAYADAVLDYFWRNREHLEPWEPQRVDGFYTPGFWRDQLGYAQEEAERGVSARYYFVERAGQGESPRAPARRSPRVIGTANFTQMVDGVFCACYLGYGMDYTRQGEGLMYEALSTLVPTIAETRRLHRVMANYRPENERSGRLLERLGFVVEGLARDYLFIDGAWRDHVLTAYTVAGCPAPDLNRQF